MWATSGPPPPSRTRAPARHSAASAHGRARTGRWCPYCGADLSHVPVREEPPEEAVFAAVGRRLKVAIAVGFVVIWLGVSLYDFVNDPGTVLLPGVVLRPRRDHALLSLRCRPHDGTVQATVMAGDWTPSAWEAERSAGKAEPPGATGTGPGRGAGGPPARPREIAGGRRGASSPSTAASSPPWPGSHQTT